MGMPCDEAKRDKKSDPEIGHCVPDRKTKRASREKNGNKGTLCAAGA